MRSAGLEFRTLGPFEPTRGARVFDGGALPARADPGKRNLALAGVLDGVQPREMCFLGPQRRSPRKASAGRGTSRKRGEHAAARARVSSQNWPARLTRSASSDRGLPVGPRAGRHVVRGWVMPCLGIWVASFHVGRALSTGGLRTRHPCPFPTYLHGSFGLTPLSRLRDAFLAPVPGPAPSWSAFPGRRWRGRGARPRSADRHVAGAPRRWSRRISPEAGCSAKARNGRATR